MASIVNREEFNRKLQLLYANRKSHNTLWDKNIEEKIIKLLNEC